MGYDSTISFCLDTICPWHAESITTYLAKRRLAKALEQIPSDAPVTFTVKYLPYQLYPGATQEGEDKYEWYKKSRYGDSAEKMEMYQTLMSSYGSGVGINFKFGGTVANTLQAHRVIQHYQETKGPETADKLINSLYRQYFEEEKHPSSPETLLTAATEAGIPESDAKAFIDDQEEGLMEVKMLIREQAGNGVDAVPYIVLEGKRRDITIEGCREVDEYVKELQRIIKESA
ncbi:DSBA-like thioredoxin domain [Teratosphaeria destructans]|uniref:DSBA-like thioredoxin domain n=1 Tax=Teratosphaeria destructans TaxID=418781 RepID=A0A9W7W428_9PEZI|nr:DSBA-like thioredoxin domain [Teratosphaeria destructans]